MLQHAAAAAIGAAQRSASVRALGLVPRYGQLQPHHPADAESETRGEDGNQSEHESSRPMFDPVEQQTETRDNDFAVPGASDEQPSEKEPRAGYNPSTGEVGGPHGPEPTRYGDWERGGRVSDF